MGGMGLIRSVKTAVTIGALAVVAAGLGAVLPVPAGSGGPGLLAAELSAVALPDRAARDAARAAAPNPDFYLDGAFYQPDIAEGFTDPVALARATTRPSTSRLTVWPS